MSEKLAIKVSIYHILCDDIGKGKNKRLGTGSHFLSKVAPGSLGFCRNQELLLVNREPLLSNQIERDIILARIPIYPNRRPGDSRQKNQRLCTSFSSLPGAMAEGPVGK